MNFTNTYEATGSITFEGTKKLTGRTLKEDDVFTFEVKEGNTQVATGNSDSTGKITYTEINYDLDDVGEHTYTVTEVIPADTDKLAGVTYTTSERTVTVVVSDNGAGTLKVEAKTDKGLTNPEALNFTNTYAATGSLTMKGTKTLEGRSLTAKDIVTFEVKEGTTQVATGTSDATGKIT